MINIFMSLEEDEIIIFKYFNMKLKNKQKLPHTFEIPLSWCFRPEVLLIEYQK